MDSRLDIFTSAKVVVSKEVQWRLGDKWNSVMEEADEELGLNITFKKKTYTFDGSWEKIIQLHDLIRGQLDVLGIGNEEHSLDTSSALRSTLMGHSPSASELGVRQVNSYRQNKGGSFKQSITSLNEDHFQSARTLQNVAKNEPEVSESSASITSSRRYEPSKVEEKETIIQTKKEHDLEKDGAEESIEPDVRTIKAEWLSKNDDAVDHSEPSEKKNESHKSLQRQASSHSSMPSLEACTVVDDNGDEEKLVLSLTDKDHIKIRDQPEGPSGGEEFKRSVKSIHDIDDKPINDFSLQITARAKESKQMSDDMQTSMVHLEEEYAAAKQTKTTQPREPDWDDQMKDTEREIKIERTLMSYKNGSFDMFAGATPMEDSDYTKESDEAYTKEDTCEQYVDSTVWAFVKKVYRKKLQEYEHAYKVSYECENEDDSSEFQIVTIKARSLDADKAEASQALCQLIAVTQQECSMQVVKTARLVTYEKCVEAITELREKYPDVEIKDNFKKNRQFLFIGYNDEAVAASKQFKRAIGMLPPPEMPEEFKHRRTESPSGFPDGREKMPTEFTDMREEKHHQLRHGNERSQTFRHDRDETVKHAEEESYIEDRQAGETKFMELNECKHGKEKITEDISHGKEKYGDFSYTEEELTQHEFHPNNVPKPRDKSVSKEAAFTHVDTGKFKFKFDGDDDIPGASGMVKSIDERKSVTITKFDRKPDDGDDGISKVKAASNKIDVEYGTRVLNPTEHDRNNKYTDPEADEKVDSTVVTSEKSKIPAANVEQHISTKPPSYNLDQETQSIKLSKQQSPTIQLLFQLLENYDPDESIESLIDEILSGRPFDDTGSGFFQENLLPDDNFKANFQSPVAQAASSNGQLKMETPNAPQNSLEDELKIKVTKNTGTVQDSGVEEMVQQSQVLPQDKMSRHSNKGVEFSDDHFGEEEERKISKIDPAPVLGQSLPHPYQYGKQKSKSDVHECQSTDKSKAKIGNVDTETDADKWLMSRLSQQEELDSKMNVSVSANDRQESFSESVKMEKGNDNVHITKSVIQRVPNHKDEVKAKSLSDGNETNMYNGMVVPPNKKVAHGTIMAQSFFGEELAGPSSIHSNTSSVSEDEVVEPLKVKKAVYQPPEGTMHRLIDKKYHLPGHENEGTQLVTFTFKQGRQGADGPKPRETFNGALITSIIPNGVLGKCVYKLMKEAFDQRKLFTIEQIKGDSCITPRIHFKSDKTEYPDETYLRRLKAALEQMLGKQ